MSRRKTPPLPNLPAMRTQFAMLLFDTSDPPVTAYRAARLAGIDPSTLYEAIRLRMAQEERRCPTCGLYPGQHANLWRRKSRRAPTPRPDLPAEGRTAP